MTPATRATRPAIGLVILTTISLLLSLAAYVRPALATHGGTHPLVTPVFFAGADNRTCGEVDQADYEFKINTQNPNGTFDEDSGSVSVTPDEPTDFEVTLTTTKVGDTVTLKFQSNLPVQSVFLKGGGNGSHLYDYAAYPTASNPEPVTYDEGLHVPGFSDISHVSFCFDELPLLPALEITKTPDGGTVNAGDPISFTIIVANTGDAAALNVDIDDALPAGFAWTETPDTSECSINGQDLHCDIDTLAPDAGFSVTVSAETDGSVCGNIPNVAFADADGIEQIENPGDVTISCAEIRIEKTPDENPSDADANDVAIGEAITFVLTVFNDDVGEARGVSVFDDLPGTGWSVVGGADTTLSGCAIAVNAGDETLSCGPDIIGGNSSKKVTATRTAVYDADCGQVNNTVSVETSNDGADDDSGRIDVLCANIVVDKTPDDGEVNAPGTATFTIVTSNTGSAPALGTTLFDDLPEFAAGWDLGAFDWASCSISDAPVDTDGDTVVEDIGEWLGCGGEEIEAGGHRTVAVSASVTTEDCGPLPNAVEVETSNDGTDDDTGLITVRCPELGIDKTTTTPEVNAGEEVSYTIALSNTGDGPANDVVVTDDLPDGITWSETSDDCEITAGTLSCGQLDIAAGSSFSVTVTGTTDAGECPDIENSASFTSSNAGSGSTADVPTEIIVNCPDLEVVKDGSDVVVADDDVEFTITVTNNGDGDAFDVALTDNLPALGSGSWSITGVVGIGVDDCGISADVLTCELDELTSGGSFSVTMSATSDPDDCPSLENDASVSASNEPADQETLADNTDSHTITVNCPDTSIDKAATTPAVNAGDEAVYTVTVTAGGSGTNEAVTLTDQLIGAASDWDFVVSGDGANEDCSIDAEAFLLCEFGNLEPGESVTIMLTYQTTSDDCPSVANTASVSATDDIDLSDNESDEITITVNCPDVTIDKEPVESPISAGEHGQFTLLVSNAGPGAAYDVEVEDTPEPGTTWTVVDGGGFVCSSAVVLDQQTLTCTLDELAAEASATVLIGYTTSEADCGDLDNAVTVFAGNEPDENLENNLDDASMVVECPGLNLVKQADVDPIDAGEEASFTITLWNRGPGDAFDVELHDDLPAGLSWDFEIVSGGADDDDCRVASSIVHGGVQQMSIDCDFGTVAPTSMEGGIVIRVFADTDRGDCGLLENTATADASNLDVPLTRSDSIMVKCPEVEIVKTNNQPNPVLPGTNVTFTLNITVSDGPAENVVVVDTLPTGYDAPMSVSDAGTYSAATRTITWNLGTLPTGAYQLTYQAAVSAGVAHRTQLVNVAVVTSTNSQCPNASSLAPECDDDSTVTVRVPTLVIDKVASTETILISGPNNALVATPTVVTWTLSYTLTNGPVTNAVIIDPVPTGFTFLDASNGGTFANGSVTWNLGALTSSGSVTFRTTVDPTTISRAAPTLNTATIDSDDTAPDTGQDSVSVTVEFPVLAGTPTPRPQPVLPNTAMGIGLEGTPITVPIELLVAFFIGSLGALTLAKVKARSRRRR